MIRWLNGISAARLRWLVGVVLVAGLGVSACSQRPAPAADYPPVPSREELSGGQATVFDTTRNAFSHPVPGLEREQELLFFVGNSFFNQNWVTAPASTTARDGLGPLFNARSCASCHFLDGRGRLPAHPDDSPTGFLIRLSVPGSDLSGAPLPEPTYGGQFQNHAILGVPPEGRITITYTEITGAFADGTPYTLRKPTYALSELGYGALHPETMHSPRVANQMIGLGLLEAVPEETILALADPRDRDGDGISGRPNYVWDAFNGRVALGRFGWKANQPHLLQQVASAFNGDIGITSRLRPTVSCTAAQPDCMQAPTGGEPEISDEDLLKVVLYSSALAVPARRNWAEPQVRQGQQLFGELGCASCHVPQLTTGVHPTLPALSHQTIYPYTDLLLHDMGPELADGRPDFAATGSEWRTPPLWGIGLFGTVNGHTTYLHDGRARDLLEAVLWHGGEAEASKQRVLELSQAERDALIAFLESL
ncbi:MAG: c-type cytochrome [Chloroflexaceae bacterium]|nr:c-type cytochrome [Chloroflexaceae bacterium]